MISIFFKLKDPQKLVTQAKQKPTLIYMMASFKLTETKPDGSFRNLPLKYSTGLKIKPRF